MSELQERLIALIEQDHKVIASNATAMGSLSETLRSMQTTMELLVNQVTIGITQRTEAVPIKVFLIVVGVMALIIVVGVLGISMADLSLLRGGG